MCEKLSWRRSATEVGSESDSLRSSDEIAEAIGSGSSESFSVVATDSDEKCLVWKSECGAKRFRC
jgi:hypothetical protein